MRDPNQKYPEHPAFFSKASHRMNGPFSPIPFDEKVSTKIDWEGELAVIIGRRGRNIPEASAMDHAFGFSVIDDTTARDLQQTRINGVVRQDADTGRMSFEVPTILAELSMGLALEPGDIMETQICGIGLIRNEIKAV